jgi:molecular chaperone GrpE
MTSEEREGAPPLAKPPEPSEAPSPETEDWKTRYHYLLAEFDNYRKRTQRELRAAAVAARAELLLRVIALHDGIERARDHLPPEAADLRQGLERVLENFRSLLDEEQLRPVGRVGEPFRPEEHEAVGSVPPTAQAPAGTVAAVVQEGYRGPNGLLRPAKVLVAAAPPEPTAEAREEGEAEGAKVQAPEPSPPDGGGK